LKRLEQEILEKQKADLDTKAKKKVKVTKKKKKRKSSVCVKTWLRLKDGSKIEIPRGSYEMLYPLSPGLKSRPSMV
jgi:hypothetical protein